MKTPLKLAAILAANLAIWPAAWAVFERPAGTGAIASPRDAGRGGGVADQPKLGEVLDFSEMSPVQAYSRPLFDKARRPWQPPAPPAEPVAEPVAEQVVEPEVQALPAPAIRLIGVSSAGVADMKALLQLDESPDPVWVLVGDVLQGWEVGKIDPGSVTIRRGQESMSFELYPEVSSGQ